MKKIGIMGGTFDPVHLGHITLAEAAYTEAGLDEVIMIPARIQPFKQDRKTASGEDRFRMLALLAGMDDKITVSRYELDNDGVSYTYLTLREMQRRNQEAKLFFICGADSFLKIDTWMNADELLHDYSYIIGSRPGYLDTELADHMKMIHSRYGTESILINNEKLDISSTEIRRRLAGGMPVNELIPPPVERYIREHELYR
ncbi:MAG: nicotinate-nucleotide adenylyltransferase [Bacillota bacterium]|nr:nicotinate-nucleotide adenylyltransferase [Bacillota bacterium]